MLPNTTENQNGEHGHSSVALAVALEGGLCVGSQESPNLPTTSTDPGYVQTDPKVAFTVATNGYTTVRKPVVKNKTLSYLPQAVGFSVDSRSGRFLGRR